ncbi:MAG: hypothetical protein ACYC27_02210 [Armatimonadota bacterium]
MRLAIITSLFILAVSAYSADDFKVICDFDKSIRPWSAEISASPDVFVTNDEHHSGKSSLGINIKRMGEPLRAAWAVDLFDITLSENTQFKFHIKGTSSIKPDPKQPHGGLILIEAGGRANGLDSHWMLDIPGSAYVGESWHEVITDTIKDANNPDWAADADGRIDLRNIQRALFVMQLDDPSGKIPPFTVYFDDFSATNWTYTQPVIRMAENESKPEHIRPVQRGFIGRKRDAGQQVAFNDLTGWKVLQYGQTEAQLVRSEEEPLFGEPVGKLTYRSLNGAGFIRIQPPKPVELKKFNALKMWVFGNNWEWMPDPATPPVLISVELTDKSGEKHVIELDRVVWKFWSMMHKSVKADTNKDERHVAYGGDRNKYLDFPVSLTGIEVRGCTNREWRSIYLDSLIFNDEKPNLPEFNANLDYLPFPTTPDTILPVLMNRATARVVNDGDTYRFISQSSDSVIEYTYTPKTGTLSDLSVKIDEKSFKPCDNAGLLIDGKAQKARLIKVDMPNNRTVSTVWGVKDITYKLELTVKGKSLVCDWTSDSSGFSELSVGNATGLNTGFQLFNVPYLIMGFGTAPGILWNDGVYCSTFLDWYNTNASEFYPKCNKVDEKTASYNGGSKYNRLTNRKRNPLRERQFINVSTRFEEVLPNIPNPPSPFAELTGKNIYMHVGGIALDRFQGWLETWKLYKQYGIDHVRLSHHEDAWSDSDIGSVGPSAGQGPQEFTMTLEASPQVGDAKMIEYCSEVKKLGWLVGLYTNYTDYSMLGASWDERNVTKLPNGEWKRMWPPCFNIKPLKAVEMEAWFAPRISEKFGTNTVYCDVHTCVPPWYNVDYEAGAPGAGMLSTTFKAYGALLMNERKAYGGPVFSEGTNHWFYAGLNDGNYAQIGLPEPDKQPLLLDFDLLRIHPLQANVAMVTGPNWSNGYYHLLSNQIAYGHIGFLPYSNIHEVARVYYMMQQLQSRYTQVPVEQILYRCADGVLRPISDTLPIGGNKENQAYIKYKNGLEIFANCNKEKSWKITVDGSEYLLPPYGWFAKGPDFIEYSAEIDSRRVDYVDSPVHTYIDAGGKVVEIDGIRTDGVSVIRKDDNRGLKIIPISGASFVELPGSMGGMVTAYAPDDIRLGVAVDTEKTDKGTIIRFNPDARYYIVNH